MLVGFNIPQYARLKRLFVKRGFHIYNEDGARRIVRNAAAGAQNKGPAYTRMREEHLAKLGIDLFFAFVCCKSNVFKGKPRKL